MTSIPAGYKSIMQRQVFWLVRCRAFPISKISGKECVQHSSFSSNDHSCNCSYRWDLQQLVLFQIFTGFPFHRLWSINHFQLLMHCKYTHYFNTVCEYWHFFTSRTTKNTKSRTRKSERGFILFNIQSMAKTLAHLSRQLSYNKNTPDPCVGSGALALVM